MLVAHHLPEVLAAVEPAGLDDGADLLLALLSLLLEVALLKLLKLWPQGAQSSCDDEDRVVHERRLSLVEGVGISEKGSGYSGRMFGKRDSVTIQSCVLHGAHSFSSSVKHAWGSTFHHSLTKSWYMSIKCAA